MYNLHNLKYIAFVLSNWEQNFYCTYVLQLDTLPSEVFFLLKMCSLKA